MFTPLFAPTGNDGAKAFAHVQAERSFGVLERHLAGRDFLLGRFTIADAYLVTVLNWAPLAGVDRPRWPTVEAYYQRLVKRPSVARALGEELALHREAEARKSAA